MSEDKARPSRRELKERGLLTPITDGTSPLQERVRNWELTGYSSRRLEDARDAAESEPAEQQDQVPESEENRRSVFDRFVSDDDEVPAEALEGPVVSEAVPVVSSDGVAGAVVDPEIAETEYDLDELAEPKHHSILIVLIFILIGLAIGLFVGWGIKYLGASFDGEIQPNFSVAVVQTVDSLQEENSVSI